MKRFEQTKTNPLFPIGIIATSIAVFVADLATPLGIAVWILFLLPLALSLYEWRPRAPLIVAGAATVFMVLGYLDARSLSLVQMRVAQVNRGFGIVTIWIVAAIVRRSIVAKLQLRERDWVRSGQRDLGTTMQGEIELDELGYRIIAFLCRYLDAPFGVLYVAGDNNVYRRCASYAADGAVHAPTEIVPGQTTLGQAIKDRQILRLDNMPSGYLNVTSALGKMSPSHIVVIPTEVDEKVNAAIELGFLHPVGQSDMDLLTSTAASIAVAIRSAQYRTVQAELLRQTTLQAQALQAQQEELRATNEELQQQSAVLEESQARLESQQSELEQTNCQLEEQKQILERQHDDLAQTQAELIEKAEALERANQYKSEFLANMSHELRTPLNSALILAKLLADNNDGNLTPEQVKFASTIHSSGNDLLALINDILDLSRIEAGGVEIQPEVVSIEALLSALRKTFQPIATEKKLDFQVHVDATAPQEIQTDALRVQQILRNLLANAMKFTESGTIDLSVRQDGGLVSFAVRDTGVGIRADQIEVIFEAFRQADGSTQRKYGGTGLGLTISRELARRLGGAIAVESEVGKGSLFTLTLPTVLDSIPATVPMMVDAGPPATHPPQREAPSESPPAPSPATDEPAPRVDDDRDRVQPGDRTILVIEDDVRFATILRDLVRELHFACLVATTGEEGLRLAQRYQPSAGLLDVHLPDASGLFLLDRMKNNPATRHIPVHVVSVADYAQQALAMGAIGYALKPVRREQLISAIQRLERKLDQSVRRILLALGRETEGAPIEALLRRDDVEIVTVERGADALERLQTETFDCMVLEIDLPDMSGYTVLDAMAAGEAFSFPPVIVYTKNRLNVDGEQRLRHYAKSVIIKGARSPERLLDEVSLFLHQVEAKLPPEQQQLLRLVRTREAALEGRTILLVEDDARNIFALTSVFEPKGAKLRIARNGREALDILDRIGMGRSEGIDLVLMDVMMPVMDGLTATREIRRRDEWRKLPIIALTAKAMPEDRQNCIDAGANDYIPKPIDVDKLVALVKVWLPN